MGRGSGRERRCRGGMWWGDGVERWRGGGGGRGGGGEDTTHRTVT